MIDAGLARGLVRSFSSEGYGGSSFFTQLHLFHFDLLYDRLLHVFSRSLLVLFSRVVGLRA